METVKCGQECSRQKLPFVKMISLPGEGHKIFVSKTQAALSQQLGHIFQMKSLSITFHLYFNECVLNTFLSSAQICVHISGQLPIR